MGMIRVYPHWPEPQPSQAATIGDHNLPRHEQEHSREHFAPPRAAREERRREQLSAAGALSRDRLNGCFRSRALVSRQVLRAPTL